MKRSQINMIIDESIYFTEKMNFFIPPFAKWTIDEWKTKSHNYKNIFTSKLGWDISDYGLGNFKKTGIVALTIRNGVEKIFGFEKPYAEKLLILEPFQEVPIHFHPCKIEDLINRGGKDFYIRLYNSNIDNSMNYEPVNVFMDGKKFIINAGDTLTIKPGESITLLPRQYHKIWTEKGKTLFGEVTMTNNDHHFYEINPDVMEITEDVQPKYYLANEYPYD